MKPLLICIVLSTIALTELVYPAKAKPNRTGPLRSSIVRVDSFIAPATQQASQLVAMTQPGYYSVQINLDAHLEATYNSSLCKTPATAADFTIIGVSTVSCVTITPGERLLTFTPHYEGTNGQPISLSVVSVVNELAATTSPDRYTLRLYSQNPVIRLRATQRGTAGETGFSYNWLATCEGGGSPRLGVAAEIPVALRVKVLGNPVHQAVEIDVTGAESTSLHLSLTDLRGRIVGESRTERAGAKEHYQFDISTQPAGTLLLRASTPGQSETVRLLKLN